MIKRILLLLAFLCFATTARAATINVQSATVSGFNGSASATYQVWVFSDSSWTDVSGNPHGAGSPSDKVFTQIVTGLSYNNSTKVLTIPAFTLTSTTDALVNPNVRLYLWIFQVVGASATPVKPYPNTENGIKVPPTIASAFSCSSGTPPTCASLYDLIVYTQGAQPTPSPRFTYSDAQIDAKISTASGGIPTSRSISVTAPLTGGGDLSANRTVGITKATASADGYLAAADFTIFNAKITDPLTTRGDILVRNSSNVAARLAAGGSGTYFRSNGTDPGWSSIQAGDVPSLSATYVDLSTAQASIAGAKTFTTSVNGPLFDKGGAGYNVKAYGAFGDGNSHPLSGVYANLAAAQVDYPLAQGLSDEFDTVAIEKALNMTTDAAVVTVPAGRYRINRTINIGDGSAAGRSTKNRFCSLIGAGFGQSSDETLPEGGATEFYWYGSAGGTVILVNGPVGGIRIEGIYAHLKPGANGANTFLALHHVNNSTFKRLLATHYSGLAYIIDAYPDGAAASTADGADDNKWEQVFADHGESGGKGIQIGASSVAGGILNVARNTWDRCYFEGDMELRYADSSTFVDSTAGTLKVIPPTGNNGFPSAVVFINSPMAIDDTSGGAWANSNPLFFWPHPTGDITSIPNATWALGVTYTGKFFGSGWSFRDALSLGGTSAGEIRLYEPSGTGNIYTGFVGPASISSNLVYRLPSAPPTAGQILQAAAPSGGVAATSWVNSTSSVGGADTFVQFNSVGTFQGSANFTWSNVNATLLLGGAAASGDNRERLHTQATSAGGVVPQIVVDDFSGSAGNNSFPFIAGRGARNTSASPTAVQNGDYLLGIVGKGYNGSGYSGNAALISLRAKETFGGSANGTFITLETTPASSTTRRESLRIENDGSLTNLLTDAQTNAVTTAATFNHQSTGTAANGYGSRYLFQLQDDGGTMQNAVAIDVTWVSAVSGSRNANIDFKTAATGGTLASSLTLNASGAGIFTRNLAASPSGQNGAFNLRVAGFTPANGDGARMLISGPDSIGTFNNWGSYGGGCEDCTNGSGHQKGYLSVFVKTGDTDTFTNSREASRWTSAGIFNTFKGADVASAATITPTGNLFHVTGTTTITGISTTNIQAGTCLNIIFDGVLQLTNSSTLKVAGSANYTTTAGTAMIWCWDSSAWQEFARAQR